MIRHLLRRLLLARLPSLAALAIQWAEQQAAVIARDGKPLTQRGTAVARRMGVREPERVRVLVVTVIPAPDSWRLRLAARALGFLRPSTLGLTLGHGIFLREGYAGMRLLSHELRHVHQYEEAGSIARFLPVYLRQLLTFGYERAPLEVEARLHEVRDGPYA
ncbi:DUF4157 domain-containing protein [Tahibacter amnicola]|uniref:DUF4157 domain-containing protein n=1 Tax=Tahibacter amnicola TaxID=2976241 RepID=A0ABY6B9Q2_9GAMM|nr:DUF4157 domain-containing protein [Tahibacter amnicola]UXI66512.1 DUF4157 domain-containing protein [Tahibacter amnicola]